LTFGQNKALMALLSALLDRTQNSYLINLLQKLKVLIWDCSEFKNKSPQVFYDNVQKIKEQRLEKLKNFKKQL
jgi:hypothetical protein